MANGRQSSRPERRVLQVLSHEPLCAEHLRMTLGASGFPPAWPGQFLHVRPHGGRGRFQGHIKSEARPAAAPLLRRAFSMGGLRRNGDACEIDLIYRVVGPGTRWMSGLRPGDELDVIGPLGNGLPSPAPGTAAWLVAGGIGLAPMLWFARELAAAGAAAVLFFGAQRRDLIPLSLGTVGDRLRADELPRTDLVLATDDGSVGFAGNVVEAMTAHAGDAGDDTGRVAVYTCGPELMMGAVADFCAQRSIRCHACMERSMACGIGTCQSCVVPVREPGDAEGWRYALCCSEGPVFDAGEVLWDT